MGTYNGERFLQEQLQTITAQTYKNLEIIICDDCSTDRTAEIIQEWAKRDERIRFSINEKNLGFNLNFSKCWQMATGELIAIADQDDIWELNKIEEVVRFWPEGALMVHSKSVAFTHDIRDYIDLKRAPFEGSDPKELSLFNTVSGHNMVIDRKMLLSLLPLPENVYYDWYLATRIACIDRVYYLPKNLAYHRKHTENSSLGETNSYRMQAHRKAMKVHELRRLQALAAIPELKSEDKVYFEKLAHLWENSLDQKFSPELFRFLYKYQMVIFKPRQKNFFSRLKHLYYFSST